MKRVYLLNSMVGLLMLGTIENAAVSTQTGNSDLSNAVDLLRHNFLEFRDAYNQAVNEEGSKEYRTASEIEDISEVTICSYEGEKGRIKLGGVLIDLQGALGYRVLGSDYNLYDVEVSGDNPFINYPDYKHGFISGVGYFNIDGDINDFDYWFSVNPENNSNEKDWEFIETDKHFNGQESNKKGCGAIIDPKKYVADKYGNDFSFLKGNSLNRTGFSQSDLSCYNENSEDGNVYSEGNCWVVSAYHILQYFSDTKWKDSPSANETAKYIAEKEEPKIYSRHFDSNGDCVKQVKVNGIVKDKYELKETPNFPELYIAVRHYIEDEFGRVDSGTIFDTNAIIKKVADKYGHYIRTFTHFLWGAYATDVFDEIDNGIPAIWSTSNDTYGPHTRAVCGYKIYRKEKKILWFIKKTDKFFYELRDGHTTEPRYYDISGHIGFSGLVFFGDIK